MKSPLEDTIWDANYGSVTQDQATFDRFRPEHHQAILESGIPTGKLEAQAYPFFVALLSSV